MKVSKLLANEAFCISEVHSKKQMGFTEYNSIIYEGVSMVREAKLNRLLGPKEQREEIVLPELEGLEW